MNLLLVAVVAVAVLLAGWAFLQGAQGRRKEEEARARVEQLQRDLQTLAGQTLNFSQQLGQLSQNVTKSLESVTGALQKGITDSATIAAQAQSAMAGELKNSRETLGQIQQQLGAVQQAGQQMSESAQTLQNILGGAKSRGSLGEVTLERLLEDSLPPGLYATQYRFSSGEAADAVIFLRDKKLMAIDSKFPLDAYRRIATEGDEARRAFVTAVKGHADAISKKYIVPEEGTLDLALMFVPSESVYYELLMTLDSKGQPLDAYCREKQVIAVSPNTLYAHLCVIVMGLRGMQTEENVRRLLNSLSGLEKQLEKFSDKFGTLGGHLKNAAQSYGEADKLLEKTHDALQGMLAPAPAEPALENGQSRLTFPAEAAAKKGA
jgi:DNA recombination protein RmuC